MPEVNVLLVEDEDDLRMLIGEALRMMGYRVTPAADGPQAVDAMEHGRFEIVVSDVNMPGGMSGIELADHVGGCSREHASSWCRVSHARSCRRCRPTSPSCPSPTASRNCWNCCAATRRPATSRSPTCRADDMAG